MSLAHNCEWCKKMVSTVLTATFLQLLVFSMDNAFNNDNFEKLFLVSVESVWRLSGYSSNWKWSLGKYLCYIWALSTRNSSQGRNVFDHHKFTLVAVLQLFILCMWIKTQNSLLFARHYLSHTVSIFCPHSMWLHWWKIASLTTETIFMICSSYSYAICQFSMPWHC